MGSLHICTGATGRLTRVQLNLYFLFLRFIYLFYVYEYTIALFRHTRRELQIPLQMVESHHVIAGN